MFFPLQILKNLLESQEKVVKKNNSNLAQLVLNSVQLVLSYWEFAQSYEQWENFEECGVRNLSESAISIIENFSWNFGF